MKKLLSSGLLLYTATSLIPLWKTDHWSVRVLDFPRVQLMVLGLLCFSPAAAMLLRRSPRKAWVLGIPFLALGLDAYRLYPYSPLSPVESKLHGGGPSEFSVLTVNVLQDNKNGRKLKQLIEEKRPDLVFLFEVDEDWVRRIEEIEGYEHRHYHPLDNTYGVAFLSRRPVESVKIRHHVSEDIPSYEVRFRPDGGEVVTIFGVHPRPPRPPDDESTKRDAELVIVARNVRELKGPVLVLGDMNDVAWSHTTRLFRRISGLLDPRVGRRPFSTFPAVNVLLRFPLDYIFHSRELKLTGIEILGAIDSDHLPLMASFRTGAGAAQESREEPQAGDFKEARKIIRRSQEN